MYYRLLGLRSLTRVLALALEVGAMSGKNLAELWEAQASLRARARQENALLVWGKPELVGIASSKACAMNAVALTCCAEWWVSVKPAPAAIPIQLVREQARVLKTK